MIKIAKKLTMVAEFEHQYLLAQCVHVTITVRTLKYPQGESKTCCIILKGEFALPAALAKTVFIGIMHAVWKEFTCCSAMELLLS